VEGHPCMIAITTNEVISACLKLLSR